MSRHTKGPWTFSHDGHGGMQIRAFEQQIGFLSSAAGLQEANARLIAASPDLLDAAKDAMCTLELVGGYDYVLSRLRSAIEKATSSTSQQS